LTARETFRQLFVTVRRRELRAAAAGVNCFDDVANSRLSNNFTISLRP
jgi:hypothetical protein